MFLGFNTNGLAHHDLFDAVELLAEIGYRGVAITIDHNALSPRDPNTPQRIMQLRRLLDRHNMRSVIETGARFLLDPRVKHEPTLLSKDRRRRIEFYKYAIDCAAQLGSDCVSLWSGALQVLPSPFGRGAGGEGYCANEVLENTFSRGDNGPHPNPLPKGEGTPLSQEQAMNRLIDGLGKVLDYATRQNVLISFEPEPGMLIDTMAAYETLLERINAPNLRLTLDIGHLHCQGEMSVLVAQPPSAVSAVSAASHRWGRLCHILKERLVNVHIEDMRAQVHEHLMFGEGEIDFPPVLHALIETGYTGGLYVELSRHSHEGPEAARRAFEFLFATMNR